MSCPAPRTQLLYSTQFISPSFTAHETNSIPAKKLLSWKSNEPFSTKHSSGSSSLNKFRFRQPKVYLDQHEATPGASYPEPTDRFQCIINLALQENENLKKQNSFLVSKLKRMKRKNMKYERSVSQAKKYKDLYEQMIEELAIVREQCNAYKDKARDLKNIAFKGLASMEQKIRMSTEEDSNSWQSQSIYSFYDKTLRATSKSNERKSTEMSETSEME